MLLCSPLLLARRALLYVPLAYRYATSMTSVRPSVTQVDVMSSRSAIQEALLWQRDRATRLSVEILQLQNIPFEN